MKPYILEACVDSADSARIACEAGADRLELCSGLIIGGITPSIGVFTHIRECCDTVIRVLVRPRFGDFCYTDDEFEVIRKDILEFKRLGADGVVIGVLKPDGSLDIERMKLLMESAGGMKVTLHRAFDVSADPFETLEAAVRLGIDTILTSGQKDSCLNGLKLLQELAAAAKGRIHILAAGGVCADVITKAGAAAPLTQFHMSGKETLESSMEYRKTGVNMGLPSLSEYEIWRTKGLAIEQAKAALLNLMPK
ncbi:copper homeostasis protein CutC [Diplocloster agilis]|uniref:PF03932 family protein CutC n=1 Tax=Diplocloster agilis TaxID=2850323 RepID=A0A949NH89_9FIRM|nr:copper homeostasis protein CutC [Diplocloster agilis]MBU9735825.1 copper homeostasis protein CutC [Diplocloster agilis]